MTSDYERFNHEQGTTVTDEKHATSHLPHVQNTWTLGTVLATSGSLFAVITVLVGMVLSYASIKYAANNIPTLQMQQVSNTQDIAVLKSHQRDMDAQNAASLSAIFSQLEHLNDKLDRLNEPQPNKNVKGWTR